MLMPLQRRFALCLALSQIVWLQMEDCHVYEQHTSEPSANVSHPGQERARSKWDKEGSSDVLKCHIEALRAQKAGYNPTLCYEERQ